MFQPSWPALVLLQQHNFPLILSLFFISTVQLINKIASQFIYALSNKMVYLPVEGETHKMVDFRNNAITANITQWRIAITVVPNF